MQCKQCTREGPQGLGNLHLPHDHIIERCNARLQGDIKMGVDRIIAATAEFDAVISRDC